MAGLEPASPARAGALSPLSYIRICFVVHAIIHSQRPTKIGQEAGIRTRTVRFTGGDLLLHHNPELIADCKFQIADSASERRVLLQSAICNLQSALQIGVRGRTRTCGLHLRKVAL